MIDDDAVDRAVDRVLPRHLGELQRTTGLPVAFGGTTRPAGDGRQLTITRLIGTFGDSLRLLSVISGRGLGGAAMARRTPCRVSDYASTDGITHDYDHAVVEHERLTSIMAFPIVVHGAVRAVMYGAHREHSPIGDVALRNAGVVASHITRDATALLERSEPPVRPDAGPAALHPGALDELAALARCTADPALQARLTRIHRELTGRDDGRPAPTPSGLLAPREIDALRLVAVGASNAEIAAELGLRVDTVKSYLRSAMRRLDVRNRTRAVLAAQAAGLL